MSQDESSDSSSLKDRFHRQAAKTSTLVGTPWAFVVASGTILVWLVSGPFFGFSDTWQLVINTGTTIVTFLMVFLIQNTQNRDAKVIHLKLDELIRALKGARSRLVDLEDFSDAEIDLLQKEFEQLRQRAGHARARVSSSRRGSRSRPKVPRRQSRSA